VFFSLRVHTIKSNVSFSSLLRLFFSFFEPCQPSSALASLDLSLSLALTRSLSLSFARSCSLLLSLALFLARTSSNFFFRGHFQLHTPCILHTFQHPIQDEQAREELGWSQRPCRHQTPQSAPFQQSLPVCGRDLRSRRCNVHTP